MIGGDDTGPPGYVPRLALEFDLMPPSQVSVPSQGGTEGALKHHLSALLGYTKGGGGGGVETECKNTYHFPIWEGYFEIHKVHRLMAPGMKSDSGVLDYSDYLTLCFKHP